VDIEGQLEANQTLTQLLGKDASTRCQIVYVGVGG
jgi:hypothetical protein